MLFLATGSCKKGDAGPAGPQGPQGPQGIAGNANVTQYTFGSQNLVANFAQLQITTTKDTMDKSAWFVYLYHQSLDRWYIVPGGGAGGATQYRVSIGFVSNKVNVFIDKNGPGEVYAQAKVVRILTSSQQAGGRAMAGSTTWPAGPAGQAAPLPAIDFTDYEAVRRYYQLP